MTPDLLIVLIGMGTIAIMFWIMVTAVLHDTIMSPLRIFYPLTLLVRRITTTRNDGPVLSSAELSDSPIAISQAAQIAGYTYLLSNNSYGKAMVLILLNQPVTLHVVAVGDKSGNILGLDKLKGRKDLTRVTLEGNYSKHITMYCTKDHELELLQLFDPADMAYFVDFCRAYNFELFNNNLYISQSADAKDFNDDTTMIQDAKEFLERNEKLLLRI